MELLYNPELMSQAEINNIFVEREGILSGDLISFITLQPKEDGFTHALILGQRGMGKTTLLLKIKAAFGQGELAKSWQALKFPEELYGVSDPIDFYNEIIRLLISETSDDNLQIEWEQVTSKDLGGDKLQKALLELIKTWCRKSGKRLLLLVENLDLLIDQIGDERDLDQLTKTFKSNNEIQIVGSSSTSYEYLGPSRTALLKLFKVFDLPQLNSEQIRELLIRRAEADGVPDFEKVLDANSSRLRVLEHFTGGNARLVLMLYRILTQSDVGEVRRAMEKLLDQVTPYYKAKIEILPPQQRKILDQVARATAQTLEGVTPSQIATATRLTPNQVSTQLKRLSSLGYIRIADAQGRNTYYTLSEPLYAIWHRMRLGRDERQRMQWLIDFITVWYDRKELGIQSARINVQFYAHLREGRFREAARTFEHMIVLGSAFGDTVAFSNAMLHIAEGAHNLSIALIKNYAKESEESDVTVSEWLDRYKRNPDLIAEGTVISQTFPKMLGQPLDNEDENTNEEELTYEKIVARAIFLTFWKKRTNEALELLGKLNETNSNKETLLITYGAVLEQAKRFKESLQYWERLRDLHPENAAYWMKCGDQLKNIERSKEALECYGRALALDNELADAWFNRGCVLGELGQHEEAINSLDRALELDPFLYAAWFYRGLAYQEMGQLEEAINNYNQVIEIQPNSKDAFQNRGLIFLRQGLTEKSLSDLNKALEINSEDGALWYSHGVVLRELNRYEEALYSFEQAVKYAPDNLDAWNNHGCVLLNLDRYKEAIASFDYILRIEPEHPEALLNRGLCLYEVDRYEEAIEDFAQVLKAESREANIWWLYGSCLESVERYKEALESFNRAVELDPKTIRWQMSRSTVLITLKRYEEALKSYDELLATETDDPEAWLSRSTAHIWKFEVLAIIGRQDLAVKEWKIGIDEWDKAIKAGKPSENAKQGWDKFLFMMLHSMSARRELQEFVRDHIYAFGLDEKMFPLARALDYLLSGDESIINRLSPEVRGVVQEMAEGIRSVDGTRLESDQVQQREIKKTGSRITVKSSDSKAY